MSDSDFFECGETPLKMPDDITTIPECKTCKLRITSLVPGPGNVRPHAIGLIVDENPMTTFSIDGVQHNLVETYLTIPGAHTLPGQSSPADAEVLAIFRNSRVVGTYVCVCIPVVKRVSGVTNYFSTLRAEVVKGRPRFLTLFSSDSVFMSFRGADLRGRSATSTAPAALCLPVASVITYYVAMTPTTINSADLTRLTTLAGAGRAGPPIPSVPVSNDRYRTLCTRIVGIELDDGSSPTPKPDGPGIPVSSLKCYRLDADRDIVGDKVYIGGKGAPAPNSLPSEICPGGDGRRGPSESGIKPSGVQKILGYTFGVILGLIVCGVLFWIVWSFFFKNYQTVATAAVQIASAGAIRNVGAGEAVMTAARESMIASLGTWIAGLMCWFTRSVPATAPAPTQGSATAPAPTQGPATEPAPAPAST